MKVIADGFVCLDCIHMIANGDLPGDGFTPEREKHVAESTAGWVCTDCLMMMANGELGPDDSAEHVEAIAIATAGWCYAGHDPADMEREGDGEHCDREFSWNACRTCRSPLGGSRYFACKLGA